MNWSVLANAGPVVQIHIIAAFIALAMGIVMFTRPKGTQSHKMIGRLFLGLMIITAISAIFIRQINNGQFSFIHVFVPITLFASWEAVHYVRKGNIKRHKRAVKGMFFGALLIPGALSFLPGRQMYMFLFGG